MAGLIRVDNALARSNAGDGTQLLNDEQGLDCCCGDGGDPGDPPTGGDNCPGSCNTFPCPVPVPFTVEDINEDGQRFDNPANYWRRPTKAYGEFTQGFGCQGCEYRTNDVTNGYFSPDGVFDPPGVFGQRCLDPEDFPTAPTPGQGAGATYCCGSIQFGIACGFSCWSGSPDAPGVLDTLFCDDLLTYVQVRAGCATFYYSRADLGVDLPPGGGFPPPRCLGTPPTTGYWDLLAIELRPFHAAIEGPYLDIDATLAWTTANPLVSGCPALGESCYARIRGAPRLFIGAWT